MKKELFLLLMVHGFCQGMDNESIQVNNDDLAQELVQKIEEAVVQAFYDSITRGMWSHVSSNSLEQEKMRAQVALRIACKLQIEASHNLAELDEMSEVVSMPEEPFSWTAPYNEHNTFDS